MLTNAQVSLIKSLHQKKYRKEHGLCLVEGEKMVSELSDVLAYSFTSEDTPKFSSLMTTKTPQAIAGVARVPQFTETEVLSRPTLLVLDGVQDPGNVGGLFRLAQGFNASLCLVESADPTSSKVIRSSVGTMFRVPWIEKGRDEILSWLRVIDRPKFRLEKREGSTGIQALRQDDALVLIVGSEGQGIQLDLEAPSVAIDHVQTLESLNVGHAVAIALYDRSLR